MSVGKIVQMLAESHLKIASTTAEINGILIEMLHDNVPLLVQREMNAGTTGYAVSIFFSST